MKGSHVKEASLCSAVNLNVTTWVARDGSLEEVKSEEDDVEVAGGGWLEVKEGGWLDGDESHELMDSEAFC